MFNIKKIAATAVMALVIGGGLIGGSMQATTASASDGSELMTTEASDYDGIKCEDDECLRLATLTTYWFATYESDYDGIKCEDDECLRLTTLTTDWFTTYELVDSEYISR